MNELERARIEIDAIDEEIRLLFIKRMTAVKSVLAFKQANQLPVLDTNREQLLKHARLEKMIEHEFKSYYESLLDALLKISKDFQKDQYE